MTHSIYIYRSSLTVAPKYSSDYRVLYPLLTLSKKFQHTRNGWKWTLKCSNLKKCLFMSICVSIFCESEFISKATTQKQRKTAKKQQKQNIIKILSTFSNKKCSNTCFIGRNTKVCDLVDIHIFSFDNANTEKINRMEYRKKVKTCKTSCILQKYGWHSPYDNTNQDHLWTSKTDLLTEYCWQFYFENNKKKSFCVAVFFNRTVYDFDRKNTKPSFLKTCLLNYFNTLLTYF